MIDALWRWAAGPALGQFAALLGLVVLAMLAWAWIVARREFADPFDIEDAGLIDELDAEIVGLAEDVARLGDRMRPEPVVGERRTLAMPGPDGEP